MGAEHADRLARLHQQRLVVLQPLQRRDDPVEALPVPRGPADPAIDDQVLRPLGDLGSRLFISIRSGASVCQDLAVSSGRAGRGCGGRCRVWLMGVIAGTESCRCRDAVL